MVGRIGLTGRGGGLEGIRTTRASVSSRRRIEYDEEQDRATPTRLEVVMYGKRKKIKNKKKNNNKKYKKICLSYIIYYIKMIVGYYCNVLKFAVCGTGLCL